MFGTSKRRKATTERARPMYKIETRIRPVHTNDVQEWTGRAVLPRVRRELPFKPVTKRRGFLAWLLG